MATQRRQIVILAVVVGVFVVLFFAAVGLGVTRPASGGVEAWTARLKGVDPAVAVEPAQLRAVGGCAIDPAGRRLQLSGQCRIDIPAVGRFSLRSSRRLTLAPVGEGVSFTTRVEDQALRGSVDAGDAKRLGFGRDSAQVVLVCNGLPPCTVGLPG